MHRNPVLKSRSRQLRREATPAEQRLWSRLRDRRFSQFKFRRQHPHGPYILDFYCPSIRLAIELDGETHAGKELRDESRQQRIERDGIHVLRFLNPQVYDDLDTVLEVIWTACMARAKETRIERS